MSNSYYVVEVFDPRKGYARQWGSIQETYPAAQAEFRRAMCDRDFQGTHATLHLIEVEGRNRDIIDRYMF